MARRVAHEIKNPLTPIQISAAALARDPRPNVVEASTIILEEVKRLDELARSFAQLGRLPEGPGAPVDIVELLQGLAARHSGPELSIGVDAEGTIPLVPGHHEALVRVFRNLIGNAGEAMGRGAVDAQDAGTPHIEAQVTLTPGGVVVRVMDRGPGFSEEALEALWDPEFTTKLGGTGIGLSLVKGTIEAHGGSVVADNREGGGACVTVTLPVRGEED